MRTETGTPVHTSDGHEFGRIRAVVVEPASQRIAAIRVQRGRVVTHEVEIAIDDVRSDPSQEFIRIPHQMQELERLHEPGRVADFGPFPDDPTQPEAHTWGAEPQSHLAAHLEPQALASELERTSGRAVHERAVLGPGSAVFDADGERVGTVHRVRFDLNLAVVLSLTVERGHIHHVDFELPGEMIASIGDRRVDLNQHADALRAYLAAQH